MTLGLVTSALKVFWLILNLHLFGLWLNKTSFTFFERVVVIIIWFIYLWLGCVFTVTQAFLYLWWAEATLRLWDFSLQGLLLLGSTGSWGEGFSGAQASRCGGSSCWGALALGRWLQWCTGFSLRRLLLLGSTGARGDGFSSCGSRALEHSLSSCGARAWLLRGYVGSSWIWYGTHASYTGRWILYRWANREAQRLPLSINSTSKSIFYYSFRINEKIRKV